MDRSHNCLVPSPTSNTAEICYNKIQKDNARAAAFRVQIIVSGKVDISPYHLD